MSPTNKPPPPYRGMLPFDEESAACFYGRDSAREIIRANLLGSSISMLYGPRGVGKTSVLRAGVVSALRQSASLGADAPRFTVVIFSSWRTDPLRGLIDSICHAISGTGDPEQLLMSDEKIPDRRLVKTIDAAAKASGSTVLLILDQFEQFFNRHDEARQCEYDSFANALCTILREKPRTVAILLSIREEALSKLDRFKAAVPTLMDNAYRLDDLSDEEAHEAVSKPISMHKAEYEKVNQPSRMDEDLAKTVIEEIRQKQEQWDVAACAGDLVPQRKGIQARYLELVMTRLWEKEKRANSPEMRRTSLAELGNADGIVRRHLSWSLEKLENWINNAASELASSRIAQLGRLSTEEEIANDRNQAQIRLADEVLEGRINLVTNIPVAGYSLLAEKWLHSVKCRRAYFLWQHRTPPEDPWDEKRYYYGVCAHLRNMLVDSGIKASASEFGKIGDFLESSYLTNGRLDCDNKQDPRAHALIERKARRIWERTGARNQTKDEERQNWHDAKIYSRLFYENILGAVEGGDSEKVLAVLRALQFTTDLHTGYYVINCFEAALAIYFLEQETVHRHWNRAQSPEEPPTSQEGAKREVSVINWPLDFRIPEECCDKFACDSRRITFIGMMDVKQREALLKQVKEPSHRYAIEDLFAKTYLVHREKTL